MKTSLSNQKFHSGGPAEDKPTSHRYSREEFFYEGQENRSEEEMRVHAKDEEKAEAKEKKRDRFPGNFNMFF